MAKTKIKCSCCGRNNVPLVQWLSSYFCEYCYKIIIKHCNDIKRGINSANE